jgi:glycosyltransferase involved in cell wall biosynthesis
MASLGTLVVLPALSVVSSPSGRFVVTRKFIEGMTSYAERWDGPVVTVMNPTAASTNNLDNVEVDPKDLPFGLHAVAFGSKALWERVRGAAVVLGGPHYQLRGMSRRLRSMRTVSVPCVEYTLRTRLDVVRVDTKNLVRAARRAVWELSEELHMRRDLRAAHGIQCNGTPTYDAYAGLNRGRLLYFDTRTPTSSFATREHLQRRFDVLRTGAPLRLAFSGRLIGIKGVDHLVPVARWLDDRGIPFHMTICGDGELAPALERDVKRLGLEAKVRLTGVLDFEKQLLPFLRDEVDVFVAPHLQGDPSCTYLETLACGVPIVGYGNEAFSGILNRASVGWSAPLGKPVELAKLIGSLDRSRDLIVEKSEEALRFAREHSFEKTFDRRIEHLEELVKGANLERAAS